MVSYTNAQFFKNYKKILHSKQHSKNTKNPSETMTLTVAYHSPSITSRIGLRFFTDGWPLATN